jgi:hypothetical protein
MLPLTSTIKVQSPNVAVRDRFQDWLDRTELAPPYDLVIDLSIGGAIPAPPDAEPIFQQPEISIYRHGTADGVTICWETAPAIAEIPRHADRATVHMSEAAAEDFDRCCRYFMSAVLIFLLRRAGWHHVHAATAVDPLGRGWALAGDWKAGKSTTAALLASLGWAVGSDDMVYLTRTDAGVVTVARRGAIALRGGGRDLLGRLGGRFDAPRNKTLFTPEELGGTWAQHIRPDILAFISVGDAETSMERIGATEALGQLVRWSAWVILEPDLAQEHLDLLADLARQTRCYRGILGRDLFEQPDRLMELVP